MDIRVYSWFQVRLHWISTYKHTCYDNGCINYFLLLVKGSILGSGGTLFLKVLNKSHAHIQIRENSLDPLRSASLIYYTKLVPLFIIYYTLVPSFFGSAPERIKHLSLFYFMRSKNDKVLFMFLFSLYFCCKRITLHLPLYNDSLAFVVGV